MHTWSKVRAVVLTAGVLLAPASPYAGVLDGEWIGGFEGSRDWIFMRVAVSSGADRSTGTIDMPANGEQGIPLERLVHDERRAAFEVPGFRGNLLFEGRLREDGRLVGTVRQGTGRGRFELMRLRAMPAAEFREYEGNYQFDTGGVVLVYQGPFGPAYVDYASGRFGHLYPVHEGVFVSGPTSFSGWPVEQTVRFARAHDGVVTGLEWQRGREPSAHATRRHLYRAEPVRYPGGEVSLGASLLVPASPGPHPAVVMIPGSGPVTRHALMPLADVYARNGIAVLVPDKRGAGASTGNWARATFDDLAGDALAGVAWLRSRPEITHDQIGLHGASLGGWVAPLAATRSSDVAFIIVEAAPGVSPAEHERYRVEAQMRADGFSPLQVAAAVRLMDLKFDVGRTGKGWHRLVAGIDEALRQGWASYVNPSSSLESLMWTWTHVLSYDPAPVLERLRVPVLALYGELDTIVPSAKHREPFERALRRSGNADVTIRTFPKANHHFFAAVTGGRAEFPRLREFVAGYFEAGVDWLLERVDESTAEVGTADTGFLLRPVAAARAAS